jgi:hypothetical protein
MLTSVEFGVEGEELAAELLESKFKAFMGLMFVVVSKA